METARASARKGESEMSVCPRVGIIGLLGCNSMRAQMERSQGLDPRLRNIRIRIVQYGNRTNLVFCIYTTINNRYGTGCNPGKKYFPVVCVSLGKKPCRTFLSQSLSTLTYYERFSSHRNRGPVHGPLAAPCR